MQQPVSLEMTLNVRALDVKADVAADPTATFPNFAFWSTTRTAASSRTAKVPCSTSLSCRGAGIFFFVDLPLIKFQISDIQLSRKVAAPGQI